MQNTPSSHRRVPVLSAKAPAPPPFLSQAIRDRHLVFCSGQVGVNPDTGSLVQGSVKDRTRQVLKNLSAVLTEAGSDLSLVTKVNIFLVNTDDFTPMNEVYSEFFQHPLPARTCVFVKALPMGTDVEIECVAAIAPA